jgi:hypothetical protein
MIVGHHEHRGLIPRRCQLFLAGQPPMPSALLTADFKRLETVTHSGKVGYFHRSCTTRPFTSERLVLERPDE